MKVTVYANWDEQEILSKAKKDEWMEEEVLLLKEDDEVMDEFFIMRGLSAGDVLLATEKEIASMKADLEEYLHDVASDNFYNSYEEVVMEM